jgi:hypothetical protein
MNSWMVANVNMKFYALDSKIHALHVNFHWMSKIVQDKDIYSTEVLLMINNINLTLTIKQ